MIDDEPAQFWFGPARGDERLPREPREKQLFLGRVRKVLKPLNGAFVDIGAARDAFLPFRRNDPPAVEGAAVIVTVRRPPIANKGAVVALNWRGDLAAGAHATIEAQAAAARVGPLGDPPDAVIEAFAESMRAAPIRADEIIVDDGSAARLLADRALSVSLGSQLFAAHGVEEAIAQSLEREVPMASGARLLFHETEAGALVDVDMAAASRGATGSANDKINSEAAVRLFRERGRRAISGRIIVDFLPPSGAAARAALAELVQRLLRPIAGARFGRLSADGLCDFTAPRTRRSLLEETSEPSGSGWPVEGRRFTLDYAAKSAIGALEAALIKAPSMRPRLVVAPEIGAYLSEARPQWGARLAEKHGARFKIETNALQAGRSHELVE